MRYPALLLICQEVNPLHIGVPHLPLYFDLKLILLHYLLTIHVVDLNLFLARWSEVYI